MKELPLTTSRDDAVILTDDGGELSYQTILHGLRAAIAGSRADAWWMADDLAQAIWQGFSADRLPAHASIAESVESIRQTLDTVGYGELAPHFRIASPVQHLSLVSCIHKSAFASEANLHAQVRESLRRLHLPGVRTLYITGLSSCVETLGVSEHLFVGSPRLPQRAKLVGLIRQELMLLPWQHPFRCYLV